jgi:hypothetical protein
VGKWVNAEKIDSGREERGHDHNINNPRTMGSSHQEEVMYCSKMKEEYQF